MSATCTCDNTSVSCEKWINYTLTTPTIGCPALPIEYPTDVAVQFTPTSLTGCNVGCSYQILDKDNGNAVLVNHTAKNYTSAVAMNGFAGLTNGSTGRYTVVVTNDYTGGTNTGSCDFSVTYDAAKPVPITVLNLETVVPCGKNISVSMVAAQYNATVISCSGHFDKTVGSVSADQYNSAVVKVCDSGNGSVNTPCVNEFSTTCDQDNSMTCTVFRQ